MPVSVQITLVLLIFLLGGCIGFLISNELTIRDLRRMREALIRGELRP